MFKAKTWNQKQNYEEGLWTQTPWTQTPHLMWNRLASRASTRWGLLAKPSQFRATKPCNWWEGPTEGSVYVVTLPTFQRCLEDGPDTAERRPGSGFPPGKGDRRRPSRGTSRPTGKTGETWEGNPIGSQRIHSTCSPTDFIFIIFESGGKGSLLCNGKKRSRFYSTQPNDASNTNDLCLECVARSLL